MKLSFQIVGCASLIAMALTFLIAVFHEVMWWHKHYEVARQTLLESLQKNKRLRHRDALAAVQGKVPDLGKSRFNALLSQLAACNAIAILHEDRKTHRQRRPIKTTWYTPGETTDLPRPSFVELALEVILPANPR